MHNKALVALAAALLATHGAANAAVTRLEIAKRVPFAAGQAYGNTGAYERIAGRFYGELDPKDPANAGIVLPDNVRVYQFASTQHVSTANILNAP